MKTSQIRQRLARASSNFLVVAVFASSGCATDFAGGEYERQALPQKANWSQLEGRELSTSEVIRPEWWTQFGDPYLDDLIRIAENESLDLQLAALRLDQAGIDLKDRRRGLLPDLDLSPTAQVAGGKQTTTQDSDNIAFNISWELDIWGKIRKDANAQGATFRATEMQWRATHLKLIADVASRYFSIRQFDEQIAHQTSSLDNSRSLNGIYEQQFTEGMIPRTRILNQQSEISSLASQLLELKRGRSETELKLATLLGVPAGEFSVPVGRLEELSLIKIPDVLPGDILSQRPDVLAAEFAVLNAHQLLGKARLARLPTLNLASNFNLANLVTSTWTWGLTTSFAGMFDREVGVNIKSSEVTLKASRVQYRQSVLTAFEEVEVALLNLRSRKEQMALLREQIKVLTTVRDVNLERVKVGLISQLELFETERSLLSAQQSLLSTYQQLLTDTVVLYIALGGGWPPENVNVESLASSSLVVH